MAARQSRTAMTVYTGVFQTLSENIESDEKLLSHRLLVCAQCSTQKVTALSLVDFFIINAHNLITN